MERAVVNGKPWLYRCFTKATISTGDQRQYGPRWVTSRRALLRVYEDRLECGNWKIPYGEVTDAVLYSFRSTFLRIPGYILTVTTPEKTYHFGLNGWGKFWKGELPFPVRRERGQLKFTWFSVAVRVLLLAYLLYAMGTWLWSLGWQTPSGQ
ncbi:hypothetical protein Plim_2833 [Planctopirus limnophila DSM 3776]|uniref:Uncharacterized protein n=1 Tax=Planctopirus limnophila (strain ATCC 43296 / DSM 3776 / IFAM 1008 / Mu 290) TaxID=521674 RepID=D5SRG2_PLAL2|nr:hypothetical protein Plim_2833 [Planctopirus limnophila DSM 3776]